MELSKEYQPFFKYNMHGVQNPSTESLRKDLCMCLDCKNMEICPAAKAFFEICKKYGTAFTLNRCSVPRDSSKPNGPDNLLFEPKSKK